MAFTNELEEIADPIWTATLDHPMVAELGDGTLDEGAFEYFVRQDYRYLVDSVRLFAYGVARAPTLDRMETFADLLTTTLTEEMDRNRTFANQFGISEAELEATDPSPTTRGYTDFLVRVATTGSFGDLVAVLLPCQWGFSVIAEELAASGLPEDERYRAWIETYTDEVFVELVAESKQMMDEIARESTEGERDRYRELFRTAARYEYRFWDAAWRREGWSV